MTQNDQNSITTNDRQELHLLYQNATANLAALKQSQWHVLVLYSAVVAFLVSQAKEMSCIIKAFISGALLIGAISAVLMIELYWKKISEERQVLANVYSHLGTVFRDCRKPKGDVQTTDCFEIFFRIGGYLYISVIFAYVMAIFWCV